MPESGRGFQPRPPRLGLHCRCRFGSRPTDSSASRSGNRCRSRRIRRAAARQPGGDRMACVGFACLANVRVWLRASSSGSIGRRAFWQVWQRRWLLGATGEAGWMRAARPATRLSAGRHVPLFSATFAVQQRLLRRPYSAGPRGTASPRCTGARPPRSAAAAKEAAH